MKTLPARPVSTLGQSEGTVGIKLIRGHNQWILKLTEEVDPTLSDPAWVSDLLSDLVAAQVQTLVLDLTEIDTIGSRELGLLLSIRKRFSEANVAIVLRNPNLHLRNLFRIMHFDRFFDIE